MSSGALPKHLSAPQWMQGHSSQLNIAAAEIGTQIEDATTKVRELRKLATQKRVFADKTSDVNRLIGNLTHDLQCLDQRVKSLSMMANTSHDGLNRTSQLHASNIIKNINTRFCELTRDFHIALEEGRKSLEHKDKQRERLGYIARPQEHTGKEYTLNGDDGQQVTLLTDRSVTASRVDAVRSVNRAIGEVAELFQRMAILVQSQDEVILGIEQDIESTQENLDRGNSELLKYYRGIASNRTLILKVFSVLIFFVVFYTVVL
jgi:syntaxin 5